MLVVADKVMFVFNARSIIACGLVEISRKLGGSHHTKHGPLIKVDYASSVAHSDRYCTPEC